MISKLEDPELVDNIQNNHQVEDSLNELVVRHSGIYLNMINSYASPSNPFIDYYDLVNDKTYKIYDAAKKFNKEKGAKFSTYLGNETKWMCLNLYNRNKKRPAFHTDFLENIGSEQLTDSDHISDSIKNDLLSKVLSVIKDHPDTRVEKIFEMRYITGNKNKVMPWKQIGDEMNLSIQGCINIHNSTVEELKIELKNEV